MKLFKCANCGQLIYFENSKCERCGYSLGFNPVTLKQSALVPVNDTWFHILGDNRDSLYRYCSNHAYDVCNWLTRERDFCLACSLNRTIPDLSRPEYLERWKLIETAKHRLIYSLLRMELPLVSKTKDPERGVFFDFIADDNIGDKKVLTGHANGIITINIAEADDIEREMMRRSMDELYRTVLGHFRHEIGHYYWERLINHSEYLEHFRVLFGDERNDYAEALSYYYQNGPAPQWQATYITAYASAHAWENWAETWAHYLHIIDTLETAYAFGLKVEPYIAKNSTLLSTEINVDPYTISDFNQIISLWVPLTIALNSLNRSMGLKDLYPFVVMPGVIEKLDFIHQVCSAERRKLH
jgi:hypothetical protein